MKRGTTLAEIRQKIKPDTAQSGGRVFHASDVLTDEEKKLLEEKRFNGTKSTKLFDNVDAFASEIMAYFGYGAYKDWNAGKIPHERMMAYVAAERARRKDEQVELELVISNMVSACIKRSKKEKPPKGPKMVAKILQRSIKIAEGEK